MLLLVYLWEKAPSAHWTAGLDVKLVKWAYILSYMIFSSYETHKFIITIWSTAAEFILSSHL